MYQGVALRQFLFGGLSVIYIGQAADIRALIRSRKHLDTTEIQPWLNLFSGDETEDEDAIIPDPAEGEGAPEVITPSDAPVPEEPAPSAEADASPSPAPARARPRRGLTEADVHRAADALTSSGERLTLRGIREWIGKGSYTTIQRLLGTWLEQHPEHHFRSVDAERIQALEAEVARLNRALEEAEKRAILAEARAELVEELRDRLESTSE